MSREDFRPFEGEDPELIEPELRQALANFRSSLDAWSDGVMSHQRGAKVPARRNWSLATKWALGCVMFAGTVTGAVFQHYRQQQAEMAEAARIAAQQREEAEQKLKDQEEEFMSGVDSDVAREVPSALEPLASLMAEDERSGN